MERLQRTRLVPVFALFLLSGATSLAYEVIWTRMLVRIFGATSFAVSTVLAAYMAGLALGSYLLGKRIDRRGSPILTYGLLELGIGCFALIFPIILAGLNPLYRSLYAGLEGQLYALSLIRFGLCFALLLVPTTLMGGTLPVLSRFVAGSLSELTFRVGWLYSINTFGAVAGTFLTGFVLLPHLGMQATTFVAVALNFTIFAVAYALSRRESPERGAGIEPGAAQRRAEAVEQRGEQRDRRGEGEDAPVGIDVERQRRVAGRRPAPSVRRTAISRVRFEARASSRLATLAQATSSTMPATHSSSLSGSS